MAIEFSVLAEGLRFPEGPVALADGSVLVVEMHRRTLTRVSPDGGIEVVAQLSGGPNGAALGPDGRCYVCNNGGFDFAQIGDALVPGLAPRDYAGGWIEAVDLATGVSTVLYRECRGVPLRGPNDLVFDGSGGMWFTDFGKAAHRRRDQGAVYYARADGSFIRQAVFPLEGPNGIGLSPDGRTLYVSESWSGRIWAYDVVAPGQLAPFSGSMPWERGRMLFSFSRYSMPDSMAIEANGNICVGDIPHGGISVITPEGKLLESHPMPDAFTTNICFGGPDLRTAFVTLSSTGRLVRTRWPRPGLASNLQASFARSS
ncbi:SMP-30/gluconolactonase/LRE family protein [Ramlibacter sp.]|uniref:SMP-30/gluconolactonase/LRE family protein n=1 Tax=Ramlibacter sp. TaxID=1917967 RepID=UPI003D0AC267